MMRAGEVPFMRSDAFAAACGMPAGISDSEAEAWLVAHPKIREWVFEQFRMSGALVFNPVKKTWSGTPRQSPCADSTNLTAFWADPAKFQRSLLRYKQIQIASGSSAARLQ
jgi:hypothetical protein